MYGIVHQLHRLLLSANLLEIVFEGLGCVNEGYRILFMTIFKQEQASRFINISHVGDGLDSKA